MSQMLPEDMMAALQGGGAPPPAPGGGGLPPDLAGMMAEPPPEPEPPPGALHGGSAAEGDPDDLVAQAIDLLEEAAKAQPSDQVIQTYLKCITQLQGTLANSEKATESGDVRPALASETSY